MFIPIKKEKIEHREPWSPHPGVFLFCGKLPEGDSLALGQLPGSPCVRVSFGRGADQSTGELTFQE